jgi:pimeloyl-ACP methyl ester carboxylesterase
MTWSHIRPDRVSLAVVAIALLLPQSGTGQQPATRHQFAPVPGGQLQYEVRGQGEPVLLIHGAMIADLLLPLAAEPALSRYQVIRVHRRGYGGSSPAGDSFSVAQDAADAAALLRHLGVARAHVVGHSTGGIVAMELAAAFPDMVQTLVLLDPPLNFTRPRTLQPRTGGADSVEAFVLAKGGPDFRTQLATRVPGALQQARRDERRFNVVEWTALGAWDFDETKARRITAPILFISQEHAATVDTAKGWWPQMEFVEFTGQTHMFPFEAPAATAQAIAGFLARHPM